MSKSDIASVLLRVLIIGIYCFLTKVTNDKQYQYVYDVVFCIFICLSSVHTIFRMIKYGSSEDSEKDLEEWSKIRKRNNKKMHLIQIENFLTVLGGCCTIKSWPTDPTQRMVLNIVMIVSLIGTICGVLLSFVIMKMTTFNCYYYTFVYYCNRNNKENEENMLRMRYNKENEDMEKYLDEFGRRLDKFIDRNSEHIKQWSRGFIGLNELKRKMNLLSDTHDVFAAVRMDYYKSLVLNCNEAAPVASQTVDIKV